MCANLRFAAASLAAVLTAGCASRPQFPPEVDGYLCSYREATAGGSVGATAYPDYRGGYRAFSMTWDARRENNDSPEANAVWTQGPEAIAPPGWLTVSNVTLDRLPPIHTKIRLQLSSGEFREQDFVEPKDWARSKKSEGRFRFAGSVHVRDPDFIEKFTQAAWADISVVDPSGVTLVERRLDLSGLSEALTLMRRLGDQVIADTSDYEHRCYAMPHVELEEIVLRTRPAADPATPGSTRTGT